MNQYFNFILADGTAVNRPFNVVPVVFPLTSGSSIVTGDPIQFSSAPASSTFINNTFKVECNRNVAKPNTWYINLSGSTNPTASANILNGSYSTGSLSKVYFNFMDHVHDPLEVNTVKITPINTNVGFNDSFVLGDTVSYTTDGSGNLTVNLVPQAYNVLFVGPTKKRTEFSILPNSDCTASAVMVTSVNVSKVIVPQNKASFGYTAEAADERFALKSSGPVTASYADNLTVGGSLTIGAGTVGAYNDFAQGYSTADGGYSHAEGYNTHASANGSHAEGNSTVASGGNSHAEGRQTNASGTDSHAEGISTNSVGNGSHAEGESTTAIGEGSHAEGSFTQATGVVSHAEGNWSIASGSVSHAEGVRTEANGYGAHTEGLNTVAQFDYETVVGKYNVQWPLTPNYEQPLFVVGNGTDDENRSDILEVTPSAVFLKGSTYFDSWGFFKPGNALSWNFRNDLTYVNNGYAGALNLESGDGSWRMYLAPIGNVGDTVNYINPFTVTNDGKIGINTSSPRGIFDVSKQISNTVDNVYTSTPNLVFHYEYGPYYAGGNYYEYRVYAFKNVGTQRVYSSIPCVFAGYDDSSSQLFYMTAEWNTVNGADGYRVVVVNDPYYGAYGDYYWETTQTSFAIGINGDMGYDMYAAQSYTYASPVAITPTSITTGANIYIDNDGNINGTLKFNNSVNIYGDSSSPKYGAYAVPLRLDSYNYTFMEVYGPYNCGIIYNKNNESGYLTCLNNSGYFRFAPMSSFDQTGVSNAKDGNLGLTVDNNGNIGIGVSNIPNTNVKLYLNNGGSGGMTFPYEVAVIENNGDNKLGIYGNGAASITFGDTYNLNSSDWYNGFECQFVNDSTNPYMRYNYIYRGNNGVVGGATANLLKFWSNGNVQLGYANDSNMGKVLVGRNTDDGSGAKLQVTGDTVVVGYVRASNFRSSDNSTGISTTCTVQVGGVNKTMTIKNGIVTSIA